MKKVMLWAFALTFALGASLMARPLASLTGSVSVCDPWNPNNCLQPGAGGAQVGTFVSAGTGQYALAVTTNTTLSVPLGAKVAQICVETAGVRYRDDGGSPTTTVGIPVNAGACFQFAGPLSALQFTAQSGSPTLSVSYYR